MILFDISVPLSKYYCQNYVPVHFLALTSAVTHGVEHTQIIHLG